MLPIFLAMLLGLLCPSGNTLNNGQPTVQVTSGDPPPSDPGGDTGQNPPPKPPSP